MKKSGKKKADKEVPSQSLVSVNFANNQKTFENTAVENDTDELDGLNA